MLSVTSPATRADDAAKLEELERMKLQNQGLRNQQSQQQQNEFAQRFGRGLTSGAASTRGQAGQRVNVPPGAMQDSGRAMGDAYWDQNQKGPNEVEQAGIIYRQASDYQKALNGGNQKVLDKAEQDLVKAYNDSEQSTPNDVTNIKRDGQGGMQFIRKDGTAVNKTPVTLDDLMNIGGNRLTGQTTFQRDPGSAMQGQGLQQPAQSKSAVKAAEMVGGANIKVMGDNIKSLEKQLEITSEENKPALLKQIDDAKMAQRQAINSAGSSVYGAGLQQGGQAQTNDPSQDMQELINQNIPDDRIKQIMWSKYGNDDVMRGVDYELQGRSKEPAGLQEPAETEQQSDMPVGKTGQPDLKLGTTPTAKSNFQQKYDTETKVKQEKEAKTKAQSEVGMKVRRLYDRMQTVKKLKPADVEYLQSVYDDPNASAKVKKEAYTTYKKYRDLNP